MIQEASAVQQLEEEKDLVGPRLPADFVTQVQGDQQDQDTDKNELFGDSYKRPRRQRAAEPLHPADERKQHLERAQTEMQQHETKVREDMQKLAHAAMLKRQTHNK